MVVFCWRNGVIEFGRRAPRGALDLATGPGRRLRQIVSVAARHAYDGKTMLVPGVPEAGSDVAALKAAKAFREGVLVRLSDLEARP